MDLKIHNIQNEQALKSEQDAQKNQNNNELTQNSFQLNNQLQINEINDQIDLSQNNLQIQKNNTVEEQIDNQKMIMNDKKFDYQMIQQSTYKQNEFCGAIAFNKDATIMIAGCDKFIKVFEFEDNKLKEIQKLNGHSQDVNCLEFMKKSNEFISASEDSTIIIWEFNQNKQWQIKQVMKEHKLFIWCIVINKNEDMLISGSNDNTIKFWNKQDNTWSSYQQINCQSQVCSISLSDEEDQLIVCLYDNLIFVIQLQGKELEIIQQISVDQNGYRLCYINSNQFLFQPKDCQNLYIFDLDAQDQMYKKGQELLYSNEASDSYCLFPIRYISDIGLVMVKHGSKVHLIKRVKNYQFTVEQSINFGTNYLYGGVTNDGRYLATWDDKSEEIQIRKHEF